MSGSFDNLSEIKMVESQNKTLIDREKSLRMVRLAELSLKKRLANSQEKTQPAAKDQVKSQKNTLLHQIHEKLSHIQNVELKQSQDYQKDEVEKRSVTRLQKMLEKVKREKATTILEPKIMQKRQIVESRGANKKIEKLKMMLREVSQARREVKVIKTINNKILTRDKLEESGYARLIPRMQKADCNEYFTLMGNSSLKDFSNGLPARSQHRSDLFQL